MTKKIKRELLTELKKYLNIKEILIITGPRQCGKTTVMKFLKESLDQKGQKTLYLSLDIEKDKPHFVSASALINKIKLEIGDKKAYIFIDEIQRKENSGLFLKGLYDMNLPYKFIVSGSGNLELKEKIHESLAGRKLIFNLNTLNFKEFVNYKTDYQYEGKWAEFFKINSEQGEALLKEYLVFGGYPRIVLASTYEEKIRFLDEIYKSYLEKDIAFWLNVGKVEEFSNLIKLISSQVGRTVNYSELANTLNLSQIYVKKYLFYLEKTFIISKLTPFFTNPRKELSKAPLYYFFDLGLKNYVLGEANPLEKKDEAGYLFENFVHNALKDKTSYSTDKLNFWRTKNGAEINFVLQTGEGLIPYEAKFKNLKQPQLGRSIHSFIDTYSPSKVFIINKSWSHKQKKGATNIIFSPFRELF